MWSVKQLDALIDVVGSAVGNLLAPIATRIKALEERAPVVGPEGKRGEKGADGAPGRDGTDGERGPQGEKGEQGPAGKDGAPGERGLPGEPGARGEPGPAGKDGAPGQAGERGAPGERGLPGEPGARGEPGPAGKDADPQALKAWIEAALDAREAAWTAKAAALVPAGRDGAPGRDGIPGRDGKDGAPGSDGQRGADGRNGADGKDGAPGEKGTNGRDGITPDDLTFEIKERDVTLIWRVNGSEVRRGATIVGLPIYRGTYEVSRAYELSDMVTYGGSVWLKDADRVGAPPGNGWKLVVKGGK